MEWVLLGIVGLVVVVVIIGYNRLVALQQERHQAFSDIDVQLKLRVDLVPNLVETVKGYATHEKELLEKVTEARSRAMQAGGDTAERSQAESALSGALMNLYAVAENYPDLKANQNFIHLQNELSDIENKVVAARRFFNDVTAEYNAAAKAFPTVLYAGMLGFHEEAFFEVSAEEKETLNKPAEVKF